jgi:uncharacterized protein (TIGR04255 family)
VSFEKPPVDEVYVAMQTKHPVFSSDNFGELVQIFGTQYPKLNTQPALERSSEREEVGPVTVQFELVANVGQRFWLISQDDTRVLQIQQDRVVYNWRHREGAIYPRYHKIRGEFAKALGKLVKAKNLDPADLFDFCEVSYTNHIELPDGLDPRGQMHRIFKHVQPIDVVADRLSIEESSFGMTLRILDEAGKFIGRMRVVTQPVIRRSDKRFLLKSVLTYRGMPASPSLDSAWAFCDAGHLAIVTTFKAITTPEMHKFWGEQ